MKMKKTLLIFLVLLSLVSIAIASVSAAGDDITSDGSDTIQLSMDDNNIEKVISRENDNSISDSIQSDVDSRKTNDKSIGESPLKDGETTIYVSNDNGDDSKDGLSEENAVATIAHAVEIAGDGSTINIANGTYNQASSITFDKSLTFIGVDGTIINRTGTESVFTYIGEDIKTFTFNNLIFTSPNKENRPIINIAGAGVLKLNSCKLTDAVPGNGNGAIKLYNDAKATLDSCEFYSLNGTSSSGAPYLAISGNSVVEVKNSIFHNIIIADGSFLRAIIYVNTNTATASVSNCKFYNISGNTMGIVENKAGTLTVSNSSFENITLNGGNCKGIIYVSETTAVGNTLVSGNSFSDNNADYSIWISASPTTVEYNAFDVANGQYAIGNNKNAELTVNYNYFGTNDNPSALLDNVTSPNWVIISANASSDSVATGEDITITADFSKYTDGTITSDLTGPMAEVPVKFTNSDSTKGILSEITYDKNKAIVTYTGANEGNDSITVTAASVSTTIPITVTSGGSFTGPIYVAKDGDDENEGSEDAPVASIKKAIELASLLDGLVKIIIKEGTYTENNINISDDLEISTVGDVIWDANGLQAFKMHSGNVNISNIRFINGNQSTSGSLFLVDGGSLSMDGCKIASNGGDVSAANGVIHIKTAILNLKNCIVENNTATQTGTSYGVFYIAGSSLIVDNCNFTNNYNKQGVFYISYSGSLPSVVVINNSRFIGNNASSSSGGSGAGIYAGGSKSVPSYLYLENSQFINNSAKAGGSYYAGEGGAIYLNNNVDATILNCRFENNSAIDNTFASAEGRGGAIASSGCNLTVINSVFLDNFATNASVINMKYNKYAGSPGFMNITNSIILSNGENQVIVNNIENGTFLANNNWWGNNSNPSDKVSEGITIDNWVIMNVNTNLTTDSIDIGDEVEITVDFKHYTNGTTTGDLADSIPEVNLKATATTGSLDKGEAITENNQAKFIYTGVATGEDTVNIESGTENIAININVISTSYEGIIYVSKDGSDSNDGAEGSPVATIAKAVELAQSGSGQIIIREGIYNENNLSINSTIPISILGEGDVLIDGSNLDANSIFNISTPQAVTIENIKFTNNKAKYGAAINIAGSRNARLDADLTINNCTFNKLEATSQGGAIWTQYLDGKLVINNSIFTNSNSSGWGGAVCVGYSAYENGLDLIINNTVFENNFANNAGGAYLMANTVAIENTSFINNSAKYYPGALNLYNCTCTINNSTLVDNNGSKQAAAIKIEGVTGQAITTVSINNSIIENNVGINEKAAAIYVDKASLEISYSSIANDHVIETRTATGYNAVYGQGIAIANNNWFGTNDPSTVVNGTNITIDKWVIMNVEANASDVQAGDEVKVTVDFNHLNTTAGGVEELTGGLIPKEFYTVRFIVENGTISPETIEVANGGSGEAVFSANDSNAFITVSSDNAIVKLIYEGEIPEPYTGIVYLSKDGSDSNDGSEEAPVASIAKAIDIATAENGSGQIIIKEGTYTGNDYLITKDLTITGEGNVVIDGEGQGRLFYMNYGADVDKFSLINLTLTGANSRYGATVYSFAKETVLNNLTIVNNPGAGDLITSYGNLTIKNSLISGHNGGDVIQSSGDADIIINSTVFENNIVTSSTSDYGIVYISSGKGNLIIEDSKFINNTARQGIVIGASDTNITVKGSEFINNTNTVSYGGAICSSGKLDLTESVFINNNAYRGGGAIYVGFRGDATITKSEFINNSAGTGYHGDAIYNANKATVNYCILLTNSTNYLIYNDGEDNVVNAKYNWWGTNDDPKSLNGKGSYEDDYGDEIDCADVDSSNWIIMNLIYNSSNLKVGSKLTITVDFNHYIDSATIDIKELDTKLAQELTVDFSSITGSLDKATVETNDLVAVATYTVVEGFNNITVKSTNAEINISFDVIPPIATDLSADEEITIVFGSGSLDVTLTSEGSPIEGKLIIVKVNDDISLTGTTNAQGIATIDLSTLAVGTYNAEIKFEEDNQYAASALNIKIIVKEAPKTASDLQKLIDETPIAGVLNLTNTEFVNVSGINITKDISIVGDNLFIITAGDGKAVFNIASNLSNVCISGVEFKANNGDVLVKAIATNGTDDLSIVNPAIELINNTVSKVNDDVVAESIIFFELESERAVLAPLNEINIKDNNLVEGVKTFNFEITGLNNGSGINIPKGGFINTNGSNADSDTNNGANTVKQATTISYKNMLTTTFNTKINGKKAGKNFSIILKDKNGKVLAGKEVIIALNGKVYKRTTNAKGIASLKIRIAKKGTYGIVVSFLGDDKYNASFIISKVKVKLQKVKLTVAKKKYKLKSKKKYLYASLKATNKKAIKGKNLIFSVNGKKYSARTNKKGIAKVKIKLSKKKTYKFNVKFAGDNTFKKVSKKGKVIIK
ncbi:Right handed beta helix region [Methanobrevibacter olleyae]|uniref:Right handed beta helix region n=2 Tax=Methanobrevibacter olleyae TaxID=294671 RepID=A0A1I4GRQ3_METOL|nr:Right handed beta helix region [Methanobrevibacter olleyae]